MGRFARACLMPEVIPHNVNKHTFKGVIFSYLPGDSNAKQVLEGVNVNGQYVLLSMIQLQTRTLHVQWGEIDLSNPIDHSILRTCQCALVTPSCAC